MGRSGIRFRNITHPVSESPRCKYRYRPGPTGSLWPLWGGRPARKEVQPVRRLRTIQPKPWIFERPFSFLFSSSVIRCAIELASKTGAILFCVVVFICCVVVFICCVVVTCCFCCCCCFYYISPFLPAVFTYLREYITHFLFIFLGYPISYLHKL